MSYEFYKVLHLIGLFSVWAALGAVALHAMNGGTRASNAARGLIAGTHGFGLVAILVAGFGMLAKHKIPMDGWVGGKLALWLVMGALLALPMRKPELAKPMWFALPILGGIGAWLAIYKPF